MSNLWGREPVAIVAAVEAILIAAVGFGLDLTAEQITGLATAATLVLALIVRPRVTPNGSVPDK